MKTYYDLVSDTLLIECDKALGIESRTYNRGKLRASKRKQIRKLCGYALRARKGK